VAFKIINRSKSHNNHLKFNSDLKSYVTLVRILFSPYIYKPFIRHRCYFSLLFGEVPKLLNFEPKQISKKKKKNSNTRVLGCSKQDLFVKVILVEDGQKLLSPYGGC
jgi:hypothetical protein